MFLLQSKIFLIIEHNSNDFNERVWAKEIESFLCLNEHKKLDLEAHCHGKLSMENKYVSKKVCSG